MPFIAHSYLNIEQTGLNKVICHGFKDGMSVADVDIPDGVTEIADFAFCTDNEDIIRVHCPESLTRIGAGAFECCENLEEITLPKKMNGVLDGTFGGCLKLRQVIIPEGITEIKKMTFNDCESIEEIFIPDTVRKIGFGTFTYCSSLICLSIPDSVKEIGMPGTIEFCTKLEKIRLPQDVCFTWEYDCGRVLFNDCPSLHTMEVGDRKYSFDAKRFEQFYDAMKDTKRPWSDEEMKAVLVDCCTPKDGTVDPVYDVSDNQIDKIKNMADCK